MTIQNKKKQAARNRLYLWIIIPITALALLGGLMSWRIAARKRLRTMDSSAKAEISIPVKVLRAQRRDIPRFIRYSGVITAWQQAIILSEVSGKVKSIKAKVGDRLEPGSPLLKIDDEMLRYTVEQAQANVLQLEANHQTSGRELKRKQKLYADRVISEYEFDLAQAKEKADRALLDSAKASLKIARRDLRETLITSPITGTLAERFVDIGTNIGRGTRVATVVKVDRVKIKIGVSEKQIADVAEGQMVQIETDAYAETKHIGSVYSVGTKADDLTLSFPVEIMVVNDHQPMLKPGMVARAAIQTGTYRDVISLPQEAVLKNGDERYVWTVNDNSSHKRVINPVELVGSEIVIDDGLNPGRQVVVSGQERLFEGGRVVIIKD